MLRCLVVVDENSLIQLYPFPIAEEHLGTVDTVGSPRSVFNKHSNWKTGRAVWWIEEARRFSNLQKIYWRRPW